MSTVLPNFSASQISREALRAQLLIRSILLGVRTSIPVEVVAVHPGSGSPPEIGTVDVQPLVQAVDDSGNLWTEAVRYGVPFCRIQTGNTAIVMDPAVGDIGVAVANDRDISSVLASGGIAGPGSARKHNLSDLVYVLSIISASEIAQYIWANANGITVLTPNTLTLQGQQINLIGPVAQTNGDVTMETKLTVPNVDATTDVTVPNGSVNNHVHTGVTTGLGSTGPMTG